MYSESDMEAFQRSKNAAFRHLCALMEMRQSAELFRMTAPADVVNDWKQLDSELSVAIKTCQKILV